MCYFLFMQQVSLMLNAKWRCRQDWQQDWKCDADVSIETLHKPSFCLQVGFCWSVAASCTSGSKSNQSRQKRPAQKHWLSLRFTKHKNTTHLVLIMFRWGRIIGCCPNRLEAKERWTWQLSAGDSRTFPVSFLSCPWMLLLLLTRGKYSSAGRKTRYMKRNKLILESRFMPFCSVFVRPDWRPQPSGRLQEIVF